MLKTYRSEYEIQSNYGSGWEVVTTELVRSEGLARLREYRENEPQYAHRMVRRHAITSEVIN